MVGWLALSTATSTFLRIPCRGRLGEALPCPCSRYGSHGAPCTERRRARRGCVVSTKPDHTGPSHTTFVCVAMCPVLVLSCLLSCVEGNVEPCQSAQPSALNVSARLALALAAPDSQPCGLDAQCPGGQMHSRSLWAGHCLVCPVARMGGWGVGSSSRRRRRRSPRGGGFGRQLVTVDSPTGARWLGT